MKITNLQRLTTRLDKNNELTTCFELLNDKNRKWSDEIDVGQIEFR